MERIGGSLDAGLCQKLAGRETGERADSPLKLSGRKTSLLRESLDAERAGKVAMDRVERRPERPEPGSRQSRNAKVARDAGDGDSRAVSAVHRDFLSEEPADVFSRPRDHFHAIAKAVTFGENLVVLLLVSGRKDRREYFAGGAAEELYTVRESSAANECFVCSDVSPLAVLYAENHGIQRIEKCLGDFESGDGAKHGVTDGMDGFCVLRAHLRKR